MRISDVIGMCFQNLWRRKVRTLLTVLGVVIGSCAIVVMISLGLGSNAALEQSLSEMGELNVVTISGYNGGMGGGSMMLSSTGSSASSSSGSNKDVALDDKALEAFKRIDGVTAVMPTLRSPDWGIATILAGKNNRYANSNDIVGIDLSTLDKFGYEFLNGGIPTEIGDGHFVIMGENVPFQFRDVKKRWGYNMINPTKADGTPNEPFFDPMTQSLLLTINNKKNEQVGATGLYPSSGRSYEYKLTPSGTMKGDWNKSGESFYGFYVDIPFMKEVITSFNRLNGIKDNKDITYSDIKLWVEDLDDVKAVQDTVTEMGYQASSMEKMREEMQAQVIQLQMLLSGLAAISLFVAAIGITNTMIMSIYERTREIGVMKVLGCFIVNIRQIFLMEAGCIGLFGGILGGGISIVISIILNAVGGTALGMENMYMGSGGGVAPPISIVPVWLLLLSLIFSTVIGLVSGFYPANRAVKISALEAIKQE